MISPADLEKVEFSVSFRGYNGDQVDDYIDMVVKEFTDLTNEYEKYKTLCEKQNEQIKIMRERILEFENSGAPSNKPALVQEPETVVKTVLKTVVDTKASQEAFEKAKALEKLSSEFKAKALELYKSQLSELEALDFSFNVDDYTVEAEETETVEETHITIEDKQESVAEDISESVELAKEEEKTVEDTEESTDLSPVVEDEPTDINEEVLDAESERTEDLENEEAPLTDDDSILSAEEIDALCEGNNDELNNILDELSGLFGQGDDVSAVEDEEEIKTEPQKATVTPKLVQQSFDSLFITSVDDSE